jgi:NAD(P)-dependent dehydrogenase (short-subunit alcohol dehydrogenase family)
VVNDVDADSARSVVDEITAEGGHAVSAVASVAEWSGAESVIRTAIDAFGQLHALVNNAGMTRHRPFTEMTEAEWDSVINVNLKSDFLTARFAAAYWRERAEAGKPVAASVVNTSSRGGLFTASSSLVAGNPGMANYGAAKAGVAGLSEILARELAPYGVRVNCITPSARTFLTTSSSPALREAVQASALEAFDEWDPANISPLVAWLSTAQCPLTGRTFWIKGGRIAVLSGWSVVDELAKDSRWTIEEIDAAQDRLASRNTDKTPAL